MDRAKDQAVDDDPLKILAQTRANQVIIYLIRNGKVAAERLRLRPPKIISATDKQYGRVEFYLSTQ
jgi:hypothetical protein